MSSEPEVTEMCCGAACDRDKRDAQLKLLGAREFNRLLKTRLVATDAFKHQLDEIETEYNASLKEHSSTEEF